MRQHLYLFLSSLRSANVKAIMRDRIALAASKGCDGIEPDNVDGHEDGNANFGFTAHDQIVYNTWLATGTFLLSNNIEEMFKEIML